LISFIYLVGSAKFKKITYKNENFSYPPFFDDNPFGIYEKILAGKIVFPSHIDANAKDLIKKLLTADRTKRIGNLKVLFYSFSFFFSNFQLLYQSLIVLNDSLKKIKSGAEDVKQHKWFKGINWDDVWALKDLEVFFFIFRSLFCCFYLLLFNEIIATNFTERHSPRGHL